MSFSEATASELSVKERQILVQVTETEAMLLTFIAGKYKTQKICEKAVEEDPYVLEFGPLKCTGICPLEPNYPEVVHRCSAQRGMVSGIDPQSS